MRISDWSSDVCSSDLACINEAISCSGRLMRSQNRDTGRKQSLTETSDDNGNSSCCNTGSTCRLAKISPGSNSTGSRLMVAAAAAVSMLVAPGPIDDVQANVDKRFFMRL